MSFPVSTTGRINLMKMVRGGPKHAGYYQAQLRSVIFYFSIKDSPDWTEMEAHALNLPLPLYIHSDTEKRLRKQTKNPVVKHMIHLISLLSPVWAARADVTFKLWHFKELKMIQDLYSTNSDKIMSFEELRLKYNLSKIHFFKYLHFRSFLKVN